MHRARIRKQQEVLEMLVLRVHKLNIVMYKGHARKQTQKSK